MKRHRIEAVSTCVSTTTYNPKTNDVCTRTKIHGCRSIIDTPRVSQRAHFRHDIPKDSSRTMSIPHPRSELLLAHSFLSLYYYLVQHMNRFAEGCKNIWWQEETQREWGQLKNQELKNRETNQPTRSILTSYPFIYSRKKERNSNSDPFYKWSRCSGNPIVFEPSISIVKYGPPDPESRSHSHDCQRVQRRRA